jgi:F-type H+-transporting ATPase subunit alpha
MPLADQVMIINAGVEGVLDDLPVDRVREFERDFLKHMNEQRPDVSKAIAQTKDLADELRKALTEATREFKAEWLAGQTAPAKA